MFFERVSEAALSVAPRGCANAKQGRASAIYAHRIQFRISSLLGRGAANLTDRPPGSQNHDAQETGFPLPNGSSCLHLFQGREQIEEKRGHYHRGSTCSEEF